VQPHLDWFREQTPGQNPSIKIVNHGLGPAIIEYILVKYKVEELKIISSNLPEGLLSAIQCASFFTEWDIFTPGTPMRVGQEIMLFECLARGGLTESQHSEATALLKEISITIRYRSIYRESFLLTCESHQ